MRERRESGSVTSFTQSCVVTVGTVLRVVRRGHVTDPIKLVTVLVRAALAGGGVGAAAVHVTVAATAEAAVRVHLTLVILGAGQSAVNDVGPVTHGAHGVLEGHVECESPLAHAAGVLTQIGLTVGALEETRLQLGAALPEPAAVYNVESRVIT